MIANLLFRFTFIIGKSFELRSIFKRNSFEAVLQLSYVDNDNNIRSSTYSRTYIGNNDIIINNNNNNSMIFELINRKLTLRGINIRYIDIDIDMSQGIEEIRHFQKCLVNWGNSSIA